MRLSLLLDLLSMNNRYIISSFVARNLKLKYRKSVLGILWTILVPAAMALVYYVIFQKIMHVQIENYLLFILSGILPWAFFSSSVAIGLESIVGNFHLLSKAPIAPHVFPLSETLTALINFIFTIPILLAVMFFSEVPFSLNLFWSFFLIAALFFQGYFLALLCGTLFVFLRDLRHIMTIVLQIWFYITPILYNSNMVPNNLRVMHYLNPIAFIFNGFHDVLFKGQGISILSLIIIVSWTLLIMCFSTLIYQHNRNFLVERI